MSLEGFRWVGVGGYERFNSMSQFPICGAHQYKYRLTELYWRWVPLCIRMYLFWKNCTCIKIFCYSKHHKNQKIIQLNKFRNIKSVINIYQENPSCLSFLTVYCEMNECMLCLFCMMWFGDKWYELDWTSCLRRTCDGRRQSIVEGSLSD